MQLEEQAAGIAEDLAGLIATPERSGGGLAIHAGGLLSVLIIVSRCHGSHDLQKREVQPQRRTSKGKSRNRLGGKQDRNRKLKSIMRQVGRGRYRWED